MKSENTQVLDYNHVLDVVGIIQNDCDILLEEKNINDDNSMEIRELKKGIAHIQGLCYGLKKVIDYHLMKG